MDLDDTPEQAAYRAQVRSWLEEHRSEAPVYGDPTNPDAIRDEDILSIAITRVAEACRLKGLFP